MSAVVWIADTSSLLELRAIPRDRRSRLTEALHRLASEGRLCFPKQVLDELERGAPDEVLSWANAASPQACVEVLLEDVREVLSVVAEVLDPEKESGVDEADPYVLALAMRLQRDGRDARVVTDERKDSPRKLSLNTACGILGIPSLPFEGLLRAEGLR